MSQNNTGTKTSDKWILADKLKEAIQNNKTVNSSIEWALYHALMLFQKDVSAQFDASDNFYNFHKSFRQTDVTSSGHGDMIIWELLKQSELIGEVFKQVKPLPQPPTKTSNQ